MTSCLTLPVTPAQAGVQAAPSARRSAWPWIDAARHLRTPAFAGMTKGRSGYDEEGNGGLMEENAWTGQDAPAGSRDSR